MLVVVSPAKTLDFATPAPTQRTTQPRFLERSAELVVGARQLSPEDIRELMGVSERIAELNHGRFMDWHTPFNKTNARPAVLAFKGDVYIGLDAASLNGRQMGYAQQRLRILSGLYGLLRPLDLIQAYRLEMGVKFSHRGNRNLYDFWGDELTRALNAQLAKVGAEVLVNLASQEYFRAVHTPTLAADVVTPVFKDRKGEGYKVISFFAKRARGQMTRFIIEHEVSDIDGLKAFNQGGYRYNRRESSARELVFTRNAVAAA